MIWCNADEWSIPPMQVDGSEMGMALVDIVNPPELSVGRKCRPWNLHETCLKLVPKKTEHNQPEYEDC